jgi:hypothetical protein
VIQCITYMEHDLPHNRVRVSGVAKLYVSLISRVDAEKCTDTVLVIFEGTRERCGRTHGLLKICIQENGLSRLKATPIASTTPDWRSSNGSIPRRSGIGVESSERAGG